MFYSSLFSCRSSRDFVKAASHKFFSLAENVWKNVQHVATHKKNVQNLHHVSLKNVAQVPVASWGTTSSQVFEISQCEKLPKFYWQTSVCVHILLPFVSISSSARTPNWPANGKETISTDKWRFHLKFVRAHYSVCSFPLLTSVDKSFSSR